MTHDTVARLVGTWGQLYMIVLFVAVLAFSLWPRKGRSMADAARIPLADEATQRDDSALPPCCRSKS
ncbi:MAG: cbb3-type cytochrome c oxidase subunit 3 [Gemmatimonas sp.]